MVERALELRPAIDISDNSFTQADWALLESILQLVKPFESATKEVSGSHYSTLSTVTVLHKALVDHCRASSETGCEIISKMADAILDKLNDDKYKPSVAHKLASLLDPR